tara:strand:+ start:132 stop:383 length:252 start_codon:yes stop_codon:yes gene_type:complete
MAVDLHRAQDPPASYIKLYRANWLLKSTNATGDLYSTDQGSSWFTVDDASGKIEVIDSYLYVEDVSTLSVWQLPVKSKVVFET